MNHYSDYCRQKIFRNKKKWQEEQSSFEHITALSPKKGEEFEFINKFRITKTASTKTKIFNNLIQNINEP